MNVIFQDLQQVDNPRNSTSIWSPANICELIHSLNGRRPFLFELRGENGYTLTIGFGGDTGVVQFGASDGAPPYLMAMGNMEADEDVVEFLAGDTPSQIPNRYSLPIEQVGQIAMEFVSHGGKAGFVKWEEI